MILRQYNKGVEKESDHLAMCEILFKSPLTSSHLYC